MGNLLVRLRNLCSRTRISPSLPEPMSSSSQSTPKRKRGEQSTEEVKVVRRSERQKAKGQESVMERAMNLKKVRSLESKLSTSFRTSWEASSSTAQADSAGSADAVKKPASETAAKRVSQSAPAGNSGVAKVGPSSPNPASFDSAGSADAVNKPASETAAKRVSQAAPAGNGGVPKAVPSGPNSVAFDPLRISSMLNKNMSSAIPLSTTFCDRAVNDHTQKISTDSGKDKGDKGVTVASPHTTSTISAPRTPAKVIALPHTTSTISAPRTSAKVVTLPHTTSTISASRTPANVVALLHTTSTISAPKTSAKVVALPHTTSTVSALKTSAKVVAQPLTTSAISAPEAPAKGKSSASAARAQSGATVIKSKSKESQTVCAGETNIVPEQKGKKGNDAAQSKKLSENGGAKTISLDKKPMVSSTQQNPIDHIRSEGLEELLTNPPLLEPLGERCQLCGIDLAFSARGHSNAGSGELPFSAVLPCSHSYHDYCLLDIFGSEEPPCIKCLEVEVPKGS